MLLTKEMKKELEKKLNDIDVEPDTLNSARWDSNPYGVEEALIGSSAGWVYDDQEYYEKQKEILLEIIDEDGIEFVIEVDTDNWLEEDYEDNIEELTEEAKKYIKEL